VRRLFSGLLFWRWPDAACRLMSRRSR
jgi:hypothetical protein